MNDKFDLDETLEEDVSAEENDSLDENSELENDSADNSEPENNESDNSDSQPLSKEEQKRLKKEAAKKAKEEKRKKLLEEKERKKQERLKKIEEYKNKKKQKQEGKESVEDNTDNDSEKPEKKKKEKPQKEKKPKPQNGKKPKTLGDKMIPYEEDEENNPKIKLYNSIARAAYNLSVERIPLNGVPTKEAFRIFHLVKDDYPELFWLHTCVVYNDSEFEIKYRCLGKNGKVDKGQIARKRNELRKAAAPFIKGITRKTDPYQAILTVYRRLILTLDYDGVGLVRDDSTINDTSKDDNLRSLHSALVTHKVVCAGYAVAFQYLMNLIGVTSACVTSEFVNNSGHAFNVIRIKNKCYYVDPTWGDKSNTSDRTHAYDDLIGYDYFCVPYKELILTSPGMEHNHIPNREEYPNLKQFDNTEYEYYRYHKAYLIRRDDKLLLDVFVNAVKNYDENEMGRFTVSFRTPSLDMFKSFESYIRSTDVVYRMMEETRKQLKGTKFEKKLAYLTKFTGYIPNQSTYVMILLFEKFTFKKEKKKKK